MCERARSCKVAKCAAAEAACGRPIAAVSEAMARRASAAASPDAAASAILGSARPSLRGAKRRAIQKVVKECGGGGLLRFAVTMMRRAFKRAAASDVARLSLVSASARS